MASPQQRPASLLVAVSHDSATSFVHLAFGKARSILGMKFDVHDYTDDRANLQQIYVDLVADRHLGRTYVVGVLIAHGAGNETGMVAGDGSLLFEEQSARCLAGAVLLLCSCLKSGKYPSRIVEPNVGVRAVIGFKDKLRIMPRSLTPFWWSPAYWNPYSWYNNYRNAFNDALLTPLRALVVDKCSIAEACNKGRAAWTSLVGDTSFDERLRHELFKNSRNLTHWPDIAANQTL